MDNSFFLKSPTTSLIANGRFLSIDTPASDAADLSGKFESALKRAFEKAKANGIEKPIVVGAIPFDPLKKSALYIPESWRRLEEEEIKELVGLDERNSEKAPQFQSRNTHGISFDEYTSAVATAISEIKAGKLDKVVVGRTRHFDTVQSIEKRALIARLIRRNPNSYNFLLPLPQNEGYLAGSSPELLIRKQGAQFISEPLAGSAPRGKTEEEDKHNAAKLSQSTKDLHEHKLVVDWMRSVLQPVSSTLDAPSSPHTINTSKLWHLATTISGTVKNENDTSLSLAGRLHPTPALSGFPHEAARDLLTRLESFDREYFGGIVGYCDSEGNGEWFVAIRCMQIDENHVTLFAGAGIVADSDPVSEWHETETKLTTMESVFK